MKGILMKEQLTKGLILLGFGLSLTSCVDDSYDLSKDIDMTVQLGAAGLQVKLGNTERIHLSSLLEIEEEEMIEQTADSLYYLIEDGTTNFNFEVQDINSNIDIAELNPEMNIINYSEQIPEEFFGQEIPFKAGQVFTPEHSIKDNQPFNFKQYNIGKEVVSIKRIIPDYENRHFSVSLEMTSNPNTQQDFVFNDITNLKINLPSFIKTPQAPNSTLVINKKNINQKHVELMRLSIDAFEMAGELGLPIEVDNEGVRFIELSEDIQFEGNFSLKANSDFNMVPGDFTGLRLIVRIDGATTSDQQHTQISLKEVTGVFDPTIDPDIDPIDISKDLPDFLNDDDVVMDVANPTIKFNLDMQQIPTFVNFFSDLSSHKNNQMTANVRVPAEGVGHLIPNKKNTLYFFQGEKPFDPQGQEADAQLFQVKNLSSLVTKIPDEIRVNLSEGHIRLDQTKLQTVELAKTYYSSADYTIYVPFQFNKGLKVVYKDSTDSFEDDLEDYMAEGAEISATIVSTIPLALKAKVIPLDKMGKELTTVKVSDAQIPAADNDGSEKSTPISLTLHFENPADLQKLDKLRFRVEAGAEQNNGILCSNQYLEVKDMRLKLTGPVIADLN